ncbi:MAG: DNA polymerase III subunit delta [Acidimicrobiales bacterium]
MTVVGGSSGQARSAYLVRGDDPSLVGQAVHDLLAVLVEERDPAVTVEEHGTPGGEELEVGPVLDALTTPPLLTDRRVVVVREAGRLSSSDAARIVTCLAEPVSGVVLVLAAGGGTIPAALVKASQAAGGVLETAVGTGRARTQWLAEQLRGSPVRLDARAAGRLGQHLGGDVSRLRGLLGTLASAYGEDAAIDETRLEPFLGEAGAVAPWVLTDAIAEGDTPGALSSLERLLGAGGFHPLAVLAVLHHHYQAMLRLDGSGATTAEQAAAQLGSQSTFMARKALDQARRLGSARLGRAVTLLAEADLDLRGRSGLPGTTVLEVLVGRLSRLGSVRHPPGRSGTSRSAPARRRR